MGKGLVIATYSIACSWLGGTKDRGTCDEQVSLLFVFQRCRSVSFVLALGMLRRSHAVLMS